MCLCLLFLRRWICIYPAYINSKKSRQEGRKIRKDACVDNPTHQEMEDVLSVSNLRIGIEKKLYPREKSKVNVGNSCRTHRDSISFAVDSFQELLYQGRIRVQLRNDDGTIFNPEFPTRDSLLLHLGTKIPLLKSRQGGRSNDGAQSQPSTSGGGKKTKGKKR